VINSTISGNNASRDGGGIYSGDTTIGPTVSTQATTTMLTVTNSTIVGNSAHRDGGGIYNGTNAYTLTTAISMLTITNSTVLGNSAEQDGGGIYNSTASATGRLSMSTLTVSNSTIASNTASRGQGGGIYDQGRLSLTNSTVSGNTASSNGGGLAFSGGQATITFCTIYGNRATQDGGGLSIENNATLNTPISSSVEMRNSIVAGNHADGGIGPDIVGALTTDGYNLFQDSSGAIVNDPHNKHISDLTGNAITNLGIDTILRANGGPTKTLALLAGSTAIDKIPPAACLVNGISTDQRGVKRPQGKGCDIGAYEY